MAVFHSYGSMTPYLIFIVRFGIGMGWLATYMNIVLLFPTLLKTSAAGIASLFAKVFGILVPFIAELEAPFNILVLLAGASLALCLSTCLIVQKEHSK